MKKIFSLFVITIALLASYDCAQAKSAVGDQKLSRAEALQMVLLSKKISIPTRSWITIKDVKPDQRLALFVSLAVDSGLISLYPDKTFRPKKWIRAGEFSVLAMRTYGRNFSPKKLLSKGKQPITKEQANKILAAISQESSEWLQKKDFLSASLLSPSGCSENKHLEDHICMSNFQKKCSVEHGNGYQDWDTGLNDYTDCSDIICDAGYELFRYKCVSHTTASKKRVGEFREIQIQKDHLEMDQLPPDDLLASMENDQKYKNTLYVPYFKMLRQAHGLTTQKEKVQAVYDWITHFIDYDDLLYRKIKDRFNGTSYTWQGALRNAFAVCGGYSDLFAHALSMLGIPNAYISGMALNDTDSGPRGPHAWNKAQIDGTWYYFDTTWDSMNTDDENQSVTKPSLDYFMLPKECIDLDHQEDGDPPTSNEERLKYLHDHFMFFLQQCPHLIDQRIGQMDADQLISLMNNYGTQIQQFFPYLSKVTSPFLQILNTPMFARGNRLKEEDKGHLYIFTDPEPNRLFYQKVKNLIDDTIREYNLQKIIVHDLDTSVSENLSLAHDLHFKFKPGQGMSIMGNSSGSYFFKLFVSNRWIDVDYLSDIKEKLFKEVLKKCNADPKICPPMNLPK